MIEARWQQGGTFLKEMRARRRSFELRPVVAARISVPDDLRWWYWLEFGTAMRGEPGRASGHTYPIRPINGKLLVWQTEDGQEARYAVEHHPGIAPRRIVRKALHDILMQAGKDLHLTLSSGPIRAPRLTAMLMGDTLPFAKGAIVQSMADNTSPTVRRKGRIPDSVASQEFQAKSVIRDTSR
jgi:hypothetical protein